MLFETSERQNACLYCWEDMKADADNNITTTMNHKHLQKASIVRILMNSLVVYGIICNQLQRRRSNEMDIREIVVGHMYVYSSIIDEV